MAVNRMLGSVPGRVVKKFVDDQAPNWAPASARPIRRRIRARTMLLLALLASGIGLLLGRRNSAKL